MERKDRFLEIVSSSSSASPSSLALGRKRGSGDESPKDHFNHDVFISFRGKDTRTNFTSHVYSALDRSQIKAFIDDEDLRFGHEIRGSLLKAIEVSKLYLVIFSPDYGSSRWCLMELEKILLCSKQHGKIVIPVFYKVEPTDVRHQTGSFKDAFTKHEAKEEKEKVLGWRATLEEAAGKSGFHLNELKLESKFIDEIVAAITKELPLPTPSKVLVGIDPHIDKVLSLLRVDSSEVHSVGIWGMGGIGKTTIAKVVFHSIDPAQFDGCHFLENVREEIKLLGVGAYWNRVLSKILGRKEAFTMSLKLSDVKQRLGRKKVLIAFDDVDDSIFLHIEDLVEHHGLFGAGSKILLTSRDRHVFTKLLVDEVCEVGGLQHEEALKLFNLNAFKNVSPPVGYGELCDRVVHYTQGNPLALTVLGSALLNRDREYWSDALHKMKFCSKQSILDILRISYDGLCREEKDVFLDIACFFRGEDEDHVENLLGCFYERSSVHTIIIHLIDKSLITISQEKRIELHDSVQEMGWKMDDEEEVTDDPTKRKRLHKWKDIYRVLIRNEMATGAIQGISLNLSEAETMMSVGGYSFTKMVNLRWLKVYGQNDPVCLSDAQRMYLMHEVILLNAQRMSSVETNNNGFLSVFAPLECLVVLLSIPFWLLWSHSRTNYEVFFPHMKYLYWEAFPFRSLSSPFNVQTLVKLSLPSSKVERLWSGVQNCGNLRWMDLSRSLNLTEIPDLSKAINLESLILGQCEKLTKLHPSVQYLKKLQVLQLNDCYNLSEIPSVLESEVLKKFDIYFCKKIKEWPKFYGNKLEVLVLTASEMKEVPDFSGFQFLKCLFLYDCPNITKFPEMPRGSGLEDLSAWNTGVEEVPSSVQFLTGLHRLDLVDNHKLRSLSDSFSRLISLRQLSIIGCKLLSFIPVLPTSLGRLEVMDCPLLETISPISSQSQLGDITLSGCGKLGLESLTNIIPKLQLRKDFHAVIQGSEISELFPHQRVRVGSSITLPILRSNLDFAPGFAISYVLEFNPHFIDDKNYLRLKVEVRAHPQTDDQDLPPAETEFNMILRNSRYTLRPKSDLVVLWWTTHPSQVIREMFSPKYSSISFQSTPSLPNVKVKQSGVYLVV